MRLSLPIVLSSAILILSAPAAFSEGAPVSTIVEYDIANANAATSSSVGVASADPNVTASTMNAVGPLGSAFNSPQSFCYLDWPTGAALDPAKYYEFSVTPAGGFVVQYQTIDYAVASGGSGTGTVEVHASLDGFGSSDITLFVQNFPIDATWHVYSIDISALGSSTAPVTFRYYMYNCPASGFSGLGVNPSFGNGSNFFVNGVVTEDVVPTEATTWSRVKTLLGAK